MEVDSKDLYIMELMHYFVKEKGYKPIIIKGLENEIWLENNKENFDIVRIVTKNIYNDEQHEFDAIKTKNIISQIKKRMYRLSLKVLSIYISVGDNFSNNILEEKNYKYIVSESLEDFKNNEAIVKNFNDVQEKMNYEETGLELISKLTSDISYNSINEIKKGEKMNLSSKNKFKITYGLILVNVLVFVLMYILGKGSLDNETLINFGANYTPLTKSGQYYRLLTSAFLHIGLFHLICNMYSLYILGNNVEYFYGKSKFILIYLYSAVIGSLFTIIFSGSNVISAGASGAIFGLLGSLLYFGYNYRGYLGNKMINDILSVIIINLIIGFSLTSIGNAAHIGGLVGGLALSMALGTNITDENTKASRINGIVITLILTSFLIYLSFFK